MTDEIAEFKERFVYFRHLRTVLLSRQMIFLVGRGYCNYTEGEVYNLKWLKLSLFKPDIRRDIVITAACV